MGRLESERGMSKTKGEAFLEHHRTPALPRRGREKNPKFSICKQRRCLQILNFGIHLPLSLKGKGEAEDS